MIERHALYPGTFDPFTRGHLDILDRALRIFDRVTIAVAEGGRDTLFTRAERVELASLAVAERPDPERCDVIGFSGLLVDEMRRLDTRVAVRGIRSIGDLDHEQQMASMNRSLWPDYDMIILFSRPELVMVSGSLVRDVARCGGDLSTYVTPPVADALRDRFLPGGVG